MKAFQLSEKKEFMNQLLCSEVFDHFLLTEAEIHGAFRIQIDGQLIDGFYSEEELQQRQLTNLDYQPYGNLRHLCFELIRGRNTPSYFKFVLQLSPANQQNTVKASGTSIPAEDITAVYLNIRYQNDQLLLTTGVSYRTFVPDKSFEQAWDRFTASFLTKNGIIFSEI